MNQSHLIYRQVLDVSFPSKQEAVNGQNQISQLYRNELMPLINEIFDELGDTSTHIRIDQLEVDLGTVSSQNLEEGFKQKLRKELEDEIVKVMKQPVYPENGAEADRTLEEMTADHSAFELFAFFVKSGRLPWWASKESFESLEKLALSLIANQSEKLLKSLSDLLVSNQNRARIIYQFPDRVLAKFIALKHADSTTGEQVQKLHADFYRLHHHEKLVSQSKANLRLMLWRSAFEFWFFGGSAKNLRSDDRDLNLAQSGDKKAPYGSIFSANGLPAYLLYIISALAEKSSFHIESENKKSCHTIIQALQKGVDNLGMQSHLLGKIFDTFADLPSSKIDEALSATDATPKVKDEKKSEALEPDESFEIHNAGLVIVAPFLAQFFDTLGLIEKDSFVTDDAARRAVLLSQYIVTGQTEMPEYELILNKIICGLPVDEPLSKSLNISKIEREKVQNLLESIVDHWEALKGTSVDGLRQTFLIKDGMLTKEIDGWRLRAKRTGVDVLLDRLPWGISVIKLPWNDEILHVEW